MTACYLATEVTNTRRSYYSAAHLNGTDQTWWLPYRYDRRAHTWLRCEDKAGPTIMPTCYRRVEDAARARDELVATYRFVIVIVHATTGKKLERDAHASTAVAGLPPKVPASSSAAVDGRAGTRVFSETHGRPAVPSETSAR